MEQTLSEMINQELESLRETLDIDKLAESLSKPRDEVIQKVVEVCREEYDERYRYFIELDRAKVSGEISNFWRAKTDALRLFLLEHGEVL